MKTIEETIQESLYIQEKLEEAAEKNEDVADLLLELKRVKQEFWAK